MNIIGKLATLFALIGVTTFATRTDIVSSHPSTASRPDNHSDAYLYSGYGVVQSIELSRQSSADAGLPGSPTANRADREAEIVVVSNGTGRVSDESPEHRPANPGANKVAVRMEDGSLQVAVLKLDSGIRVGDRVRVANDALQLR
jgi:hypothetical protein